MKPSMEVIRVTAKKLAEASTESTKHMSQPEREAGIRQMLIDLAQLAENDGCIAAAWAYEFAVESAMNN